jgi:hypothetical protein
MPSTFSKPLLFSSKKVPKMSCFRIFKKWRERKKERERREREREGRRESENET